MIRNAEQGVAKAHDHPTARGRGPIERAVRSHLGRKVHDCTFRDGVCRRYSWSGRCVEIRQSCKRSFFFHTVNTWSGVKGHFRNRIILGWRRVKIAKISVESRSEEHTSELQSQSNLVCRLLLEKKNYNINTTMTVVGQSDTANGFMHAVLWMPGPPIHDTATITAHVTPTSWVVGTLISISRTVQ